MRTYIWYSFYTLDIEVKLLHIGYSFYTLDIVAQLLHIDILAVTHIVQLLYAGTVLLNCTKCSKTQCLEIGVPAVVTGWNL